MKVLGINFPSTCCHVFCRRPKFSSVFKHPQYCCSLNVRDKFSHPYKKVKIVFSKFNFSLYVLRAVLAGNWRKLHNE